MEIPLLISTDQEGGAVVYRLIAPATAMPGNMALGAGRSTEDAFRSAEVIGTELASVGINQNYGPVADVNINPANPVIGVRSVVENAELAADLVAAQVDGYHGAGIVATAKHFPGHGDTPSKATSAYQRSLTAVLSWRESTCRHSKQRSSAALSRS